MLTYWQMIWARSDVVHPPESVPPIAKECKMFSFMTIDEIMDIAAGTGGRALRAQDALEAMGYTL